MSPYDDWDQASYTVDFLRIRGYSWGLWFNWNQLHYAIAIGSLFHLQSYFFFNWIYWFSFHSLFEIAEDLVVMIFLWKWFIIWLMRLYFHVPLPILLERLVTGHTHWTLFTYPTYSFLGLWKGLRRREKNGWKDDRPNRILINHWGSKWQGDGLRCSSKNCEIMEICCLPLSGPHFLLYIAIEVLLLSETSKTTTQRVTQN